MLERDPALRWRALLTDTLPYEVPVIFSNDLLYASLVRPSGDPAVQGIVDSVRSKLWRFSVPYSYRIAKDETRYTTLSIIHPNQQLRISDFYQLYRQSILDYTKNSDASLRRPTAEMAVYSANPLDEEQAPRQGIPHIVPEDGEIDVSRMISFFSYGRYNLLGKFIESSEFRQMEKRFRRLRMIDISNCFFNIYTHSITWAVKDKGFAKKQGDTYSFESSFDRLMQTSNYNETNGIVVGPEVSRIFAEIILQDIDRSVINAMAPRRHNIDFAIRRYVDDFFIFAPNDIVLDEITGHLKAQLERYKLFVNVDKTETLTRPFVSPITLARSELRSLIAEMHECFDGLSKDSEVNDIRRAAKNLRRQALDIRLISERYGVSFSAISGWLLSTLRVLLRRSAGLIRSAPDDEAQAALGDMASTILEIAFYIAALDTRVRTTYSLCQLVAVVEDLTTAGLPDIIDRLMHTVGEELGSLITSTLNTRGEECNSCVELQNLMIAGGYFLGPDFIQTTPMQAALGRVLASPPTYFSYISAKFCLLRDQARFVNELATLNDSVRNRILSDERIEMDAETYLLACDYLSAPDISAGDKRTLVQRLCGGQPSNAAATEAGRYLGFVDWTGMRIGHALARKELRPVYSWT